jgi:hypothetical protein
VVATSRRPSSTQDGRSEHAGPGGCLPHAPRVSPSSPPDTPATLFHPHAGHTTAWPHGSASQKTSRSPPPRRGWIDDSAWDPPPSFPFFLLFPGRPPPPLSLLFSRNRRSRRRSRALESCRVASRRPVPSWSGLDPGWFLGR